MSRIQVVYFTNKKEIKLQFTYSVIIPALNEESVIIPTLLRVRELNPEARIIVADGGSSDETVRQARECGAEVVSSFTGRGIQMNEGAKSATGEIFLFLHADTLLPDDAFVQLENFFTGPQNKICLFSLKFDVVHPVLGLYEKLSRFNTVFTNFGDQCICVRREFFRETGGFAQRMLFEDVEYLRRAGAVTKIGVLPSPVVTSARKYVLNGYIRQQLHNAWLMMQYFTGRSDDKLREAYQIPEKTKYDKALIIFARYPEAGKVKTRLAETIGADGALKFYRYCLNKIFQLSARIYKPIRVFLFYTGDASPGELKKWAPGNAVIIKQQGKDLGERMHHAFCTAAAYGSKQSVIIGTDSPDLTYNMITDAFKRLDHTEIIIGASEDGGYYMLGMRKPDNNLFEGMIWSTAQVYSETLQRIEARGYSVYEMEVLLDVDTAADLRKYVNNRPGHMKDNELRQIQEFLPREEQEQNDA